MKRFRHCWVLLFFTILILPESNGQKRVKIDRQQAAVMEAALRYDIQKEEEYYGKQFQTIVLDKQVKKQSLPVLNETSNPDSMLYYPHSFGTRDLVKLMIQDSTWIGLIQEFNARSGEVSRIRKGDLQLDGPAIRLISNRSLQRIFKRKGWPQFYEKFPFSNGIYRVSSPVIRENKAVLYFSQSKGGLNGVGGVLILEKKENWQVLHFIELWVS